MGSEHAHHDVTAVETTRDAPVTDEHTVGDLLDAAEDVRQNAYTPYSEYNVGAAIVMADDDGTKSLFTGCNVEAVSYSQTTHAEQAALSDAIKEGHTEPVALAIQTTARAGGPPCGHCRQLLIEHGNMPVFTRHVDDDGVETLIEYDLDELLPFRFGPENLENATE